MVQFCTIVTPERVNRPETRVNGGYFEMNRRRSGGAGGGQGLFRSMLFLTEEKAFEWCAHSRCER